MARRKDRYPTIILLYNKTGKSIFDKTEPDHVAYEKVMERSRYDLVRKAALGLLDVNNDCKERLERIFDINLATDPPKLIMIKPITDDKYEKFIDVDTLDPVELYEK